MNKKIFHFPKDFLWGVSTSAYQIEGDISCDWSEWEKSKKRIDSLKEKGLDPALYVSGKACDSYNRYKEDVKLIKEINCNAYRLGIEWARIEPNEGTFDEEEINHYRKQLNYLKENGIKVILTLWHWTNPLWLKENNYWEKKEVVKKYSRYVEKVVSELGDLVDYWVTVNEPLMMFGHGYWSGKFPPNHKRDLMGGVKVSLNLLRAHKEAYKIIHKYQKNAQVGIAMTSGYFDSVHRYNPIEMLMVKVADYLRNFYFLNKVKNQIDYIGVNYYHHDRLVWHPPFKKNENKIVSDFGWEIFPEGIFHVLRAYKKYKKPIYVLENGIADSKDEKRADFIKNHLYYIHKAIEDGADVRGYFHWSLLDNFEWADGYNMKFGLYSVDRKTFERKIRPSAKVYSQIALHNKLEL